ncbi:MAG: hypothetical protein J6R06_08325 [Bacteroidales bacterium]|nr:hypothetical protein [Bacteroidales bacterium]
MSRGMKLSVLGLYTFNNHLFDEMRIPYDFNLEDRETIIGNILAECAELEILFPDYNVCKSMIGLWSRLNFFEWNRIYKLAQMEYNPIENYNKTEIETIKSNDVNSHSGEDVSKLSGTDTQLTSTSGKETNNGTDKNENYITAYNGDAIKKHDESFLTHNHTIEDENTGSNATNYGKTETLQHGEKITREGENTRENHTTGNIGTMTSQDMATQEVELTPKINVMKIIVNSFKERFCLLVY